MKKWMLKAIVQKGISYLPYRYHINRLFQKYVTKGLQLHDEHFGYKIQHATDHIRFLRKYHPRTDVVCLELGTGWYPVVPIALFLSGARQMYSIDVASHISKENIRICLEKYLEWYEVKRLEMLLPFVDMERWQLLQQTLEQIETLSLEKLLDVFRLKPIVGDARNTHFADGTIDFIHSNNTFEHIYPDILSDILAEFKRVICTGGGMSHFIDLSDHFAHFDNSITIYHFLQYSPQQWKRIDNDIQPQNRLRWRDYRAMYHDLGIPLTEEVIRKGSMAELQKTAIHPSFSSYTSEELAVSHGYMVSVL